MTRLNRSDDHPRYLKQRKSRKLQARSWKMANLKRFRKVQKNYHETDDGIMSRFRGRFLYLHREEASLSLLVIHYAGLCHPKLCKVFGTRIKHGNKQKKFLKALKKVGKNSFQKALRSIGLNMLATALTERRLP